MPLSPIAAFLAGSLLSLLLPTLLLIALTVWYVKFLRRVPGPADGSEPARSTRDSAQDTPPEGPPPPSQG